MYKALGHLHYVCLRTILLKSRQPINRRNKSRESTILKIEFFLPLGLFFFCNIESKCDFKFIP